MLKKIISFALIVAAAFAVAADNDIDLRIGDLKPGGENDMPKGWVLNPGVKYEGTAKLAVDPTDDDGDDYVVNFDVTSGSLHIYFLKLFPVAPGETIKLEAEVMGQGKAGIGLYFYKGNKYIGDDFRNQEVAVNGKMEIKRQVVVPATLKDGDAPDQMRVAFFVTAGSKITLDEIEAEKIIK